MLEDDLDGVGAIRRAGVGGFFVIRVESDVAVALPFDAATHALRPCSGREHIGPPVGVQSYMSVAHRVVSEGLVPSGRREVVPDLPRWQVSDLRDRYLLTVGRQVIGTDPDQPLFGHGVQAGDCLLALSMQRQESGSDFGEAVPASVHFRWGSGFLPEAPPCPVGQPIGLTRTGRRPAHTGIDYRDGRLGTPGVVVMRRVTWFHQLHIRFPL